MKKILLALQYWDGDREQALKLARFIASMEPRHSEIADFMFICRFDSSIDLDTVQEVSRKFNVYTHKSRRQAKGWPYGCNELWFDTMTRIYELKAAKKMPDYKAVLTFEADCSPLVPDWIAQLSAEWDKRKVTVLGHLSDCGGGHWDGWHINGNALFSGDMDFLKQIRSLAGCRANSGWDLILAPRFKKMGWSGTEKIVSKYGRKDVCSLAEYETMLTDGTVLLHGFKNDSLLKLVKARHFPGPKINILK